MLGEDLAGSQRAIRRLRAQCERANCTQSSLTQVTIEINSLFEGTDYLCSLPRARFGELFIHDSYCVPAYLRLCDGRSAMHAVFHSG